MKCPNDGSDLHMTDRQGIEIDYCPKCRGVWLDRGELDKLIEKSSQDTYPVTPQHSQRENPRYDDDDYHQPYQKGKRKKGGFLGDLFEFGD